MRDAAITILIALAAVAVLWGLCLQVAADTITITRPGASTVTIQVPPEADYTLSVGGRVLGSATRGWSHTTFSDSVSATTQGYSTNAAAPESESASESAGRVYRETLTEGVGARQR
jgi:hypothetical protein